MITGTIKSLVDKVWDAFWSGGISNPLEVIEQITYLLFLRRLDDLQINAENRARRLGTPVEHRSYPEGVDARGRSYEDLRWSHFKNFAPAEMYEVIDQHVFPFLRTLGGNGSTYAHHMKDARFTIPTQALLAKVVDLIAEVPMEDRDTKGDLYEYMLSKIASAGQNGQFRTPRHIIQLMVEMTAPQPGDVICDPACGTAGFLVAAGEHLRHDHPDIFRDEKQKAHFHYHTFHGFDFDNTMLRIGSMNMLLHGMENPDIRYRDSLAQDHAGEEERYSLVLANPPLAGSLDYENTAKDLLQIVKTKKTELLFLALFVRLLKPGGRAAVIVPDGVLFGSSTAHKTLRKLLVDEQKLDAVISLPSGVFNPYAGVSTAVLLFTKTNSSGTDNVWFYDVQADGWSLDDKRTPLLSEDKLGPVPTTELSGEEHAKNNLPDVLARWRARADGELNRARTEQSFCVTKADIVAEDYDLSLNRYKEVLHEDVEHRAPFHPPYPSQGELAVAQPPQPVPTPEVYAAVAARRTQFDNLVWQVPVLSITAQAFLFTIALGADTRPVSRVIACLLSMIVTFLTVHIFTRHRQAEITDAHWLEEYEKRHNLQPGGHGHYWRALRERTSADAGLFTPLARLRGYQTWAIGLSLFGVAA